MNPIYWKANNVCTVHNTLQDIFEVWVCVFNGEGSILQAWVRVFVWGRGGRFTSQSFHNTKKSGVKHILIGGPNRVGYPHLLRPLSLMCSIQKLAMANFVKLVFLCRMFAWQVKWEQFVKDTLHTKDYSYSCQGLFKSRTRFIAKIIHIKENIHVFISRTKFISRTIHIKHS